MPEWGIDDMLRWNKSHNKANVYMYHDEMKLVVIV